MKGLYQTKIKLIRNKKMLGQNVLENVTVFRGCEQRLSYIKLNCAILNSQTNIATMKLFSKTFILILI